MIDRLDCTRIDLESLFDEGRGDIETEIARAHVETCTACQRRLEALAASDDWWRDCRAHLGAASLSDIVLPLRDERIAAPRAGGPAGIDFDLTDVLASPSHPEMLGRVGRYEVERILGRGGMGMVFKAFDSELNRPVAIKVLAPHLAGNGTARQRFGREARAAAAVVHEHVVSIHDVDTSGRLPCLVMQYVPGESLQAFIDRHGPLDVKDVVRVGRQIAAGLAAAHAQGVVHRDIKPGNIMLENGLGRIVITDFGLAQAADECSLTHTGTLAGTPHYMSPEQANAAPLDHRSDLFSLGSVLYFMATGRAPFRGDRAMAVLRHICQDQPPAVRALNPDVPAALASIIDKLHAKDPVDRFQTAEAVRDLLAAYLAHLQQPTQAPLPPALRRLQRRAWLTRRRIWWGGLAATVVAGAAVAFTSPLLTDDSSNGSSMPHGSPPIAMPADLWPLREVDQQLRTVHEELDALEQGLHAAAHAATVSPAGNHDLSQLEQAIQSLERTAN